jgi:hypothetical protein
MTRHEVSWKLLGEHRDGFEYVICRKTKSFEHTSVALQMTDPEWMYLQLKLL